MDKFFLSAFIFFFLGEIIYAKEPSLMLLVNIISNDTQEFKRNNTKFTCTPYGIVTIEKLYKNADEKSVCRKSILQFYKKNLDFKYYTYSKLKLYQFYSLLFKDKKCIINIQGEKSLSEFLLEVGLAVKIPSSLDKEYDFYFHKAEQNARKDKRGLWATNISRECISSIYSEK